jgi:PAS domain-containing protein
MPNQPDFQALFDASPYPYLLLSAPDLTIIGANLAYLRSTGKTAEEIVGKNIFIAFPENPADPKSTNVAEVRASIERAIATKLPDTTPFLRYAVPQETPNGTVFREIYWSAVHTPVMGADGEVTFVAQNAIDVTDLYNFDKSVQIAQLRPELLAQQASGISTALRCMRR